jgi:nitrate reductase gamma subunit
MPILISLAAVVALILLGAVSGWAPALRPVTGIVVPYAAAVVFVAGVIVRVWRWARSPVPFRIPTTCGQQTSLAWIKPARLDNPSTTAGVIARMALELLLFRSLFRNTRADLGDGPRFVLREQKILWLGALAFHWSLLVVALRHLRFFVEPVPAFVRGLASIDGFFQVGLTAVYATDVVIVAALGYLLARRLTSVRLRYLSLPADYFAPLLILSIAGSGILMRYVAPVDLAVVKPWAIGLMTLSPHAAVPGGVLFSLHLLLVCALGAWFPFSKLMHAPGMWLSPTRNLANDSRARRHVNPWDHPVPVHTYAEWEREFHDKIKAAGLPLDEV